MIIRTSRAQPGDMVAVTLMAVAGGGRVLKTLLCVHDQGGLVVVKVCGGLTFILVSSCMSS